MAGQRNGATTAPRPTRRPRHLVLAACALGAAAVAWRRAGPSCWTGPAGGRRGLLAAFGAGALISAADNKEAQAFENAVKQIKREINNPKRPGRQPVDLGLSKRPPLTYEPALSACKESTPNCFSTTYDIVGAGLNDYKPWEFKGKSPEDALKDLIDNINAYEPGQNGIDGGGFRVVAQDTQCIYTQFESLKRGHIDDVEFCIEPGLTGNSREGSVLVRSASRQGYFDFGVNAARLNYLAAGIEKKGGWSAGKITVKTNERYWVPNCIGGDGSKAPFSVRQKFPEECKDVPIQSESSLQGRS